MALEEHPQKIHIDYKKSDWIMDPKGYFLIDIDRMEKKIIVVHCLADGTKNAVIEGSDPIALYYTILKKDLVSLMTHAAYLGQELEKAFLAIKHGFKYVQDDVLTTHQSSEDIHTRQKQRSEGKDDVKWHRADDFKRMKQEEYKEDGGAQYH